MNALLLLIVTFGLVFVASAALAAGFSITLPSALAPLRANALPTLGVLVANFVVVPLLTGLTLQWLTWPPMRAAAATSPAPAARGASGSTAGARAG